jgi:hypothetical protein
MQMDEGPKHTEDLSSLTATSFLGVEEFITALNTRARVHVGMPYVRHRVGGRNVKTIRGASSGQVLVERAHTSIQCLRRLCSIVAAIQSESSSLSH